MAGALYPSNYSRQAEPLPRRVLGQELEPFSVGHAHLLAAIGNPFAPECWNPEAQTLDKLVEAVFVCAHSYSAGRKALRSPWTNWKMLAWGFLTRKADRFLEREVMRAHIGEAIASPDRWSTGGREPGSPSLLMVWQHLRWLRGMSEAETMEYPFGKAIWDFLGYHESRGGVQILNDTEREMIRMTREMEAERVKKAGSGEGKPQWPTEESASGQAQSITG